MAKFCTKCGKALNEGAKFCTKCGTPVPQQTAAEEPKVQAPEQKQTESPKPTTTNASKFEVRVPEEFAKRNAEKARQGDPSKKESGKWLMAVVALLIVAVIVVICIFAFRGCGKTKQNSNQKNTDALREYAESLEKAGMTEAAAAVYELIAKGGGAEYIQKAHEDIPIIEASDEAEQIGDIFGGAKGGTKE